LAVERVPSGWADLLAHMFIGIDRSASGYPGTRLWTVLQAMHI
jgi:hypothetical protein